MLEDQCYHCYYRLLLLLKITIADFEVNTAGAKLTLLMFLLLLLEDDKERIDIKDEVKVPLILGRPFLNTASAVIHVAERELSLGTGEDRITLSIDGILDYNESINNLDSMDDFTEPFESEPNDYLFESGELEESLAIEKIWEETMDRDEQEFEELKHEDKVRVKTSLEEPPDLELKDLPEHLEYQFLEGFGGRGMEKYEKRRENVKNAQSQHRRHLAIAKSST
ncbi:hypothetical protein OSB04_un000793 [Centaurea solstitialis]|uniref:Reverse transcriptase domain-containing protein n=1 Tax=Centaurea solstitialis TaxID=347529 RepID=A0AA38VRI6_9ASTR|nr:hypothetical protein OSB04_un000793 [Centaurea solstitialis]